MSDPTANLKEQMRELMGLAMTYEFDASTGTLTPVWTDLSAKVTYDYMAEELRRYRSEELAARMRFMGITPRQLMEPHP